MARHNRVVIVNRRKDFVRAKEGNIVQIQRIIEDGQVECLYETTVNGMEERAVGNNRSGRIYFRYTER